MRTRTKILGLVMGSLLVAAPIAAQRDPVDAQGRIRRAHAAVTNAEAAHECTGEAHALREVADAARGERRPVVLASLLQTLDERESTLTTCRNATASAGPRGRMRQVTSAASQSGFGRMDTAPLLARFSQYEGDFVACYDAATRGQPASSGRVSVELTLHEGSGAITRVETVENTFSSPGLASCVERVVRGFGTITPGPTGGEVTYRFPVEIGPITQ